MNKKHWPAESVEMRAVATLIPYARNARTHSKEQVAQIAASIREWGWTTPVLVDEEGGIIAGHGRVLAAQQLKLDQVPCMVAKEWTEAQKRAYVIADNKLALNAGWDDDLLRVELGDLRALDFDVALTGFSVEEIGSLFDGGKGTGTGPSPEDLAKADEEIGEVQEAAVSRLGDLWVLGPHRILCGDSLNQVDVQRLMGQDLADLVFADPPYGMGKEKDGVANDNLHGKNLDTFQNGWLAVAHLVARENCSVYVWGTAEDLWRWWWTQDIPKRHDMVFRNEIVWAKGNAQGIGWDGSHSYRTETERCILMMRGQQFLGNQNKDDYWEGYEPLRLWMVEQRNAAGWTTKGVNKVTETQMGNHWFSKSQFQIISRKHYDVLREAAGGKAFKETYDELGKMFSVCRDGGNEYRRGLSEEMRSTRSYFDNAHDEMTDVWKFSSVKGEERYGHATPKPVAMVARAVKTSCPDGGLVYDPFLGTGTSVIAAGMVGRRACGMEIEPKYIDVVVRRWQKATGEEARLEATGDTFADTARGRGIKAREVA